MASNKQPAERRRFITRKADPDLPAFLPEVGSSDVIQKTRSDRDFLRRTKLPAQATSSNIVNEPPGSRDASNIGDDSSRISAFVRVTPKLPRREPPIQMGHGSNWRSADDITASGRHPNAPPITASSRVYPDQFLHPKPIWSPPSERRTQGERVTRRQASCDRIRGNRDKEVADSSLKPRRTRTIVAATGTPDLVRSTLGFRPIRTDSQDDSESSASLNGAQADSGSGQEQTSTIRRNVIDKNQTATSTSTGGTTMTTKPPQSSRAIGTLPSENVVAGRGTFVENQSATVNGVVARHKSSATTQWQQQYPAKQSENTTPNRLARHRLSASSVGSASSYDNLDHPPTPPYLPPSSSLVATRRTNVQDWQTDIRGRQQQNVDEEPPLSGQVTQATTSATTSESTRRRRIDGPSASPLSGATELRYHGESPSAAAANHRLMRSTAWTPPTENGSLLTMSERNGSGILVGNSYQPISLSTRVPPGSSVGSWHPQPFVGSSASGHSRVVAPHMIGVYDPPKEKISRLRVVSSESVSVISEVDSVVTIESEGTLHPVEIPPTTTLRSKIISSSPMVNFCEEGSRILETRPPTVHGPRPASKDVSQLDNIVDLNGSPEIGRSLSVGDSKLSESENCDGEDVKQLSEEESLDEELIFDDAPDEDPIETCTIDLEQSAEQRTYSVADNELTEVFDGEATLRPKRTERLNKPKPQDIELVNDDESETETETKIIGPRPSNIVPDADECTSEFSFHDNQPSEITSSLVVVPVEVSETPSEVPSSQGETVSTASTLPAAAAAAAAVKRDAGVVHHFDDVFCQHAGLPDDSHLPVDKHVPRPRIARSSQDIDHHNSDSDVSFDSIGDRVNGSKEKVIGQMSLNKIVAECTARGRVAEKVGHLYDRMTSGATINETGLAHAKRPGRLSGNVISKLLTGNSRTVSEGDIGPICQYPVVKSISWTDDGSALIVAPLVAAPSVDDAIRTTVNDRISRAEGKPISESAHKQEATTGSEAGHGREKSKPTYGPWTSSGRTVGSVVEKFNVVGNAKSENPGYSSTAHVIRSFVVNPSRAKTASSAESTGPTTRSLNGTVGKVTNRMEQVRTSGDSATTTSSMRHGSSSSTGVKLETNSGHSRIEPAKINQTSTSSKNTFSHLRYISGDAINVVDADLKTTDAEEFESPSLPVEKLVLLSTVTSSPSHVTDSIRKTSPPIVHSPLANVVSRDCIIDSDRSTAGLDKTSSSISMATAITEQDARLPNAPPITSTRTQPEISVAIGIPVNKSVSMLSNGNADVTGNGVHQNTTHTTVDNLVLCRPLLTKMVSSSSNINNGCDVADNVPSHLVTKVNDQTQRDEVHTTSVSADDGILRLSTNTRQTSIPGNGDAEHGENQCSPLNPVPLAAASDRTVSATAIKTTTVLQSRSDNPDPTSKVCLEVSPASHSDTIALSTNHPEQSSSNTFEKLLEKAVDRCAGSTLQSTPENIRLVTSESVTMVPIMSPRAVDITSSARQEMKIRSPREKIIAIPSSSPFNSPKPDVRSVNKSSAFQFTSMLPWSPISSSSSSGQAAAVSTTPSKVLPVTPRSHENSPQHSSLTSLVADGSTVMAALDDALAVLSSVVRETPNNVASGAEQYPNAKNRTQTGDVVNAHFEIPDNSHPVPARRSVLSVSQLLGDVPSRYVVKSSHPVVQRRMAPPDVFAGVAEGERRRREIEAAENRRRRWRETCGRPEDDSFNRPELDEDSPLTSSPTTRSTSVKKNTSLLPLPVDSVILRHRRRTKRQRKREQETSGNGLTTSAKLISSGVEHSSTGSSSSTSSEEAASNATRRSQSRRKTRKDAGGRRSGRSTKLPPSSVNVEQPRGIAAQDQVVAWKKNTHVKRQESLIMDTEPRTCRRTAGFIVNTSERPLIASTANDCRQRVDYG